MKLKIKIWIDILMTAALIFSMAYQVTGERLHEWLGIFMFVLFLVHNGLNARWYGNLFYGKYSLIRFIRTAVNLAVFVAMLCLAYSGVVMSRYVFDIFPISGGMAAARVMHLSGSYWGFVLMSIHLGLHWGMVVSILRGLILEERVPLILRGLRLIAVLIAGYGGVCFWQADIVSYMFLKVEFAFIDYEKNGVLVLLEYMAMMGLWVFLAYYGVKIMGLAFGVMGKQKEEQNEKDRGLVDSNIHGFQFRGMRR